MISFEKFSIVFKREYLSRIKSKAYILTTILAPVVFLMFFLLPAAIMMLSPDTTRVVGLIDETGVIAPRMIEADQEQYKYFEDLTIEEVREMVTTKELQGYLVIDQDVINGSRTPELIYGGTGGITFVTQVRTDLRNSIREEKLDRAEVTEEVREIMSERISLVTRVLTEEGEEEQDTGALVILGLFLGMAIYIAMFAYGSIVMRGVIEEKTSRIIEVVVSSVKPFELLLGKVLGVGALALTQYVIWITAGLAITTFGGMVLMLFMGGSAGSEDEAVDAVMSELPFAIPAIGADLIALFLVFFVLGYLMYSAMFAAVGSALESETENQQLSILITLPIIIPIFFLGTVSSDPDSTLAIILSLIPFFSPIIMPVRAAIMNVPFWEVGLAVLFLILAFLGLMWLSARIYRVGILMYGKSATISELAKWVRYK